MYEKNNCTCGDTANFDMEAMKAKAAAMKAMKAMKAAKAMKAMKKAKKAMISFMPICLNVVIQLQVKLFAFLMTMALILDINQMKTM